MFSDCHCHLRDIADEGIRRAEENGFKILLTAGIDLKSSEQAVKTATKYRIVKACVGIHPWNADQYSEDALRRIKDLASDSEVVAISEIGLDYVGRRNSKGEYVTEYIDPEIQRTAFREQLKIAKELSLPVLVHDRTPDHEVLDILEEEGITGVGAAIHGFSKDKDYAERCTGMGIHLSIGLRPISAPENEALRQAIRRTPLKWMLTETDSGNPEGVLTVTEKMAELKGLDRDMVGKTTTQNLIRLIKL